MSADDYLLDGLCDGDERAWSFARSHPSLVSADIWERYLQTKDDLQPNPMRELAERLIREGRTTFADARAALEQHNSASPKQ